jgi:hypothetical protein
MRKSVVSRVCPLDHRLCGHRSTPPAAGPAPAFAHRLFRENTMEAERTNAIRNQLADLSARVVELRRYL